MRRLRRWIMRLLPGLVACCLALGLSHSLAAEARSDYPWDLPDWVPPPMVPADNPMSAEKAELGRHLFYEKRLSVNGQQSCGSCHLQSLAFSDGKRVSVGTTGQPHPRNSMGLANVGYSSVLTWANPLMRHLEQQMLTPLFGEEPVELGMAGQEEELLAMLRSDESYAAMFAAAFPEAAEPVSVRNLTFAIATFERTLNSFSSPYDRYRYGGDPSAISEAAKRGERLFHSEALECFHCHGGLIFSDSVQHQRLAFPEVAFHNTGLYNLDASGAYPPSNTGIHEITHRPEDMGRFRAPSLRNVALTAPYMHDGSIPTLEAAIDHYAAAGRTLTHGPYAGVGSANPLKSSFIQGFQLTPAQKQDLIAFLDSLTDAEFIGNPKFSDPHPEPSLAGQGERATEKRPQHS